MSIKYKKIKYKNNNYAVIELSYKKNLLPVVIDYKFINNIKNLNKKWYCNKSGFISCKHNYNQKVHVVFLHELIMSLKDKKNINQPIQHINRISVDNRLSNLKFVEDININYKKKKRTVQLPKKSGIDPNEIPTYIWYLKENGSHGDRFSVEISKIKWKTTSSKKVSLRYKLEEAKKFLRDLKENNNELFTTHSMNGEFNKIGKKRKNEYIEIIKLAGYDNITVEKTDNLTDKYLKESNKLKKKFEQTLLLSMNLKKKKSKRRLINNLPQELSIKSNDLPKHVYYRKKTEKRGDYFVVENHPNQSKRIWQTTSSKKISVQQKYKELLDYLKTLK
jgi:hypothetical protein